MTTVLDTHLTLSPNNQIAFLGSVENLITGSDYVISSRYLRPNTSFTYEGRPEITLKLRPLGVPRSRTAVEAQISDIPEALEPYGAQTPRSYPYHSMDRLDAVGLNMSFVPTTGGSITGSLYVNGQLIAGTRSGNSGIVMAAYSSPAADCYVQFYGASNWVAGVQTSTNSFLIFNYDTGKNFDLTTTGSASLNGFDLVVSGAITAKNGMVSSQGAGAGLNFTDRGNQGSWEWYSVAGIARLWNGADRIDVDPSGNTTIWGRLVCNDFQSNGNIYAPYGWVGGTTLYIFGAVQWDIQNDGNSLIFSGNGNYKFWYDYGGNQLVVSGNLNVGAAGSFGGTLTGAGGIYATGVWPGTSYSLIVQNNAEIRSSLYVRSNTEMDGNLQVYGALNVNGQSSFYGAIHAAIGTYCTFDQASFNNITCNGNINVGSTVTTGNLTASGSLDISGITSCRSELRVLGLLSCFSNLNVSGLSNFGNSIAPASDNAFDCGYGGQAWQYVVSYNFSNTSDAALKTDIADLPAALPLVSLIAPKRFRYLNDSANLTHWGFIAQDVAAVMAEAGHTFDGCRAGADGKLGLAYNELVAVLWQAVRELVKLVQQEKHHDGA